MTDISATAYFRAAYDAPEGGDHGFERADHAGADRPGDRSRTAAQAGHGRRPEPGQPERAEGPRRHVHAAAAVERHPELQGDLDRLGGGARHVQDTIAALQHGQGGVTSYPLSRPLEGWHAAITGGGHQVVHRTDPDTKTLHVGYAGHNIADAEQRLGATSSESSALPVEFHKGAEKDFDGLHPQVQDKVLDTVDRLSRREAHPHDHGLTGNLSSWRSARADFLNRVTHRYEDHEGNPTSAGKAARLFIGHVGPHNYEDATKRLSTLTGFFQEAALRETASVDDDDYRMQHQAPDAEYGAPLHDLSGNGIYPEDIYTHPHYYSDMSEPSNQEAHAVARRARGNPDAKVHIYRSLPAEHAHKGFQPGDWVSTSKEYARDHGRQSDPKDDWPVIRTTVRAGDLHTEGNDLREWGYNGDKPKMGMIVHKGGYNQEVRHAGDGTIVPVKRRTPKQASDAVPQLTQGEEELSQRHAAAVAHDDGIMVALVPPREIAEQLAMAEGQPVDDLHITLAYLGNVSDYRPDQLARLPKVVAAWAANQRPVTARVGGVGTFNNAYKDQHVLYAAMDIPGGAQVHTSLVQHLERHGYRLPSEHGWTPHMTLRYVDRHHRFMPQLDGHSWEAAEVITYLGGERHPACLGSRPTTTTL